MENDNLRNNREARMISKELRDELINDYNISEEQIQYELKEIGISNEYLALVQLKRKLEKKRSRDTTNELLKALRRQVDVGKNMLDKGLVILSQIETEGKNISINDENIDKLLELTANANEMIKTGATMEIAAWKGINIQEHCTCLGRQV